MDLERHLLALLGGAQVGDELLPGAVLLRISTELGWRLTLSLGDVELHIDIERAREGRPFAARTPSLLLSYRQSKATDALSPGRARAICVELASRIARHEDAALEAVRRDGARAREDASGARIREVSVSRMLDVMGTERERFYGLSPYVGCLIGCRFCYAQSGLSNVRRLEQLDGVPWGSYVDVRVDAPTVLARELEEKPVYPIKFCPIVSDPYQAVEARYGLTRACLEAIRASRRRWPVAVLTRSKLIERDAELIASIPQSYAGASIPTADDAVRKHFEPRGATIDERFAMLSKLRAAGVRTFAIVQPILPGSLEDLADRLAEAVSSVRIDVLHGVEGASAEFADPRYAEAARESWQRERSEALAALLASRGVAIWPDELPPDLVTAQSSHA